MRTEGLARAGLRVQRGAKTGVGLELGLGPRPVPEPPHVAVLVGEEAVRVVAAVLVVAEAAAEDGGRLAPRPRAAEAAHHLLLRAHVARASAAHRAPRRARRHLGPPDGRASEERTATKLSQRKTVGGREKQREAARQRETRREARRRSGWRPRVPEDREGPPGTRTERGGRGCGGGERQRREEGGGAVGVESGGKAPGSAGARARARGGGTGGEDDPRRGEEGAVRGEPSGRRSVPALPPPASQRSQCMHEGAGSSQRLGDTSKVAGRESKPPPWIPQLLSSSLLMLGAVLLARISGQVQASAGHSGQATTARFSVSMDD